jgi:hypothetical protein
MVSRWVTDFSIFIADVQTIQSSPSASSPRKARRNACRQAIRARSSLEAKDVGCDLDCRPDPCVDQSTDHLNSSAGADVPASGVVEKLRIS